MNQGDRFDNDRPMNYGRGRGGGRGGGNNYYPLDNDRQDRDRDEQDESMRGGRMERGGPMRGRRGGGFGHHGMTGGGDQKE